MCRFTMFMPVMITRAGCGLAELSVFLPPGKTLRTWPRAAAVLALCHEHCIVSPDLAALAHTTSGASDTIFMKLRSRSSRATGPKMRVPRGFWASERTTAAFSSKRM